MRSKGLPSFLGSVKRKKYHDESMNVSMVSVSRFASFPQLGHEVLSHSSCRFERAAASSGKCAWRQRGKFDWEICCRDRDGATVTAVNDWDGGAPVSLPTDEPVLQVPCCLVVFFRV